MAETNEQKWINQINQTSSSNCFLLHDARIAELDTNVVSSKDNHIPTSQLLYNYAKIKIGTQTIDTVHNPFGEILIDTLRDDMGLTQSMRIVGILTNSSIQDGQTDNSNLPGYSNRRVGDVIIDKATNYEYVYTTQNKWEQLGRDYKVASTSEFGFVKINPDSSNAITVNNGIINVASITTSTGIKAQATGLPTGDAVYNYIKPILTPGTNSKQSLWTTKQNGSASWVAPSSPLSVNIDGELQIANATISSAGIVQKTENIENNNTDVPTSEAVYNAITAATSGAISGYQEAIKSITRSGITFTYTRINGNTGTFTQQDNDTWNPLSTTTAGYVKQAPDDTTKFLRGDAEWAKISYNDLSNKPNIPNYTAGSGIDIDDNNVISCNVTPGTGGMTQDDADNRYIRNSSGLNSGTQIIATSIKITSAASASSTATGALIVTGGIGAGGNIYGAKVFNAVFNDYAEYRETKSEIEPGRVVREVGDGTLEMSTERLQRGCMIVSDTFGTSMGQTEKCNTPVAVAGRALAYCLEGRDYARHHIGWPVCAAPGGMVSVMTEAEEAKYPSRIIGIISEIPDYDTWGTDNVKVNNRIWIKVV